MSFKTEEELRCEANKKVNYRQRGSIETKKHKQDVPESNLETLNSSLSFKINNGEIIDSAVFKKIVRDCHGKEIRSEDVRRFRKVASDEWFTVPLEVGNEIWEYNFEPTTGTEIMKQYNINKGDSKRNPIDYSMTQKIIDTKNNFIQKNKKTIIAIALATLAIVAYKKFNKK